MTWFVTRVTRRVSLVDQELTTLPEHLGTPRFVLFRFDLCVFSPSSIYGFWLSLWNLQTFLTYVTVPRQESEWSCLCICVKGCLIFCILFNVLQIAVCPLYFSDCVVCLSINDFWLPLWYLQVFLTQVTAPIQKSVGSHEHIYICKGIDFCICYYDFSMDFGTLLTVSYFCFVVSQ